MMAVIFKPVGILDVSTEPVDVKDIDMVRCKNLDLSQSGVIKTRNGHSKINTTAIDTDISLILVLGSLGYYFSSDIVDAGGGSILV